MTAPFDLAAMLADREAGTEGPWEAEYDRVWGLGDKTVAYCLFNDADRHRIARVPQMEAEIIRLRDGIAYVQIKHPYSRLKALMSALLAGEDPVGFADSVQRYDDKLSAAISRVRKAELELAAIVRAVDAVRAMKGHDRDPV